MRVISVKVRRLLNCSSLTYKLLVEHGHERGRRGVTM